MVQDFDYQLENLTSPDIEYNEQRVREFLDFTKLDPVKTIRANYCLDAGCGNGCYSYSMQKLGAMRIDSIDTSSEAVAKCKQVNPDAKVLDLMKSEKELYKVYDFVLCCGALSHVQDPREGFRLLSRLIKSSGGYLHIMVFNKGNQSQYEADRKLWPTLTIQEKLGLCEERVKKGGGTVHGWWNMLNPTYNHGFSPDEIKKWFSEEGFTDIRVTSTYPINVNGKRGNPAKRDYGQL